MARIIQIVFGLFMLGVLAGVVFLAVAPVPATQTQIEKPISPQRFEN